MIELLPVAKRCAKTITMALGSAWIALGVASPASAALVYSSSVVASGLLGPRGMAFGPDGNLYVTETGIGGGASGTNCIPSGAGATVCYGATGAIGRYDPTSGSYSNVVTGLPSLATATGAEGVGINDISFDGNGRAYGILGLGADPAARNTLGVSSFGRVISIELSGTPSWSVGADIAGFEAANDPDGRGADSNPFSLAIANGTIYVTDAGGNTLVQADGTGNVSLNHVFPDRSVPVPFPPFTFSMQAVPTGITLGADNALYIAQLTGFPFPPSGATIYRASGGTVTPFATGFTNLIDIATGRDGNLYALEYATNFLAGDFRGAVWRITPDGTKTKIFSDGLVSPTGIAVAPNGTIYVANRGAIAGQGELLELTPIPEPSTVWSLVSIGIAGGIALARKSRQ